MRPFSAALLMVALLGATPAAAGNVGEHFVRLDRGRAVMAALPPAVDKILLYYGASWCGPCRAFVPELVTAYPALRRRGIEIVFVSDDATCREAIDYARTSRMPWLSLPCPDAARRARLRALGGAALPGLVLTTRDGRRLDTSWGANGISRPRAALARTLAER